MKIQVDPNYQDRGMMKWQGFILHEMMSEFNKIEEKAKNDLEMGEKLDDDFWDEESVIFE